MSAVNDTSSWQDPAAVSLMLDECVTWAVVGLSGDRSRTAYRIAELLQERGKHIVPIHPDAPTVLGQQGYATLADVPFAIDVVDVFRRSEAAGQFAGMAAAFALGADAVALGTRLVASYDNPEWHPAFAQRILDTQEGATSPSRRSTAHPVPCPAKASTSSPSSRKEG